MLRILIALPLLLILVLFALSNVQPVRLGFWPTDYTVTVPVALAVLVGMGIAFLIGAIVLWLSLLGARMRARRAEHARRVLEAQIAELQAELAPLRARLTALPAPAAGTALAAPVLAGLIAALDTADLPTAQRWAASLAPHCGCLKLGLEFFAAHGAAGVRDVGGGPVFLDLKLHDIPNTVAGAVRAVLPLAPRMLTLHAAGGASMIEAARAAIEAQGGARPLLLAVTVLTSLGAEALAATGVAGGVRQQVLRLARLAVAAGADGLVCAPPEVAMLRDALGAGPVLVVPGVRPAGAEAGDQVRVSTPREVVQAGADWLVVGRPITQSADPAAAAASIAAEIADLA